MSTSTWFRVVGLCGVLVGLGALVPAWTQEAKGKKYALLVGVTEYDSSKFATLTYSENDVVESRPAARRPSSSPTWGVSSLAGHLARDCQPWPCVRRSDNTDARPPILGYEDRRGAAETATPQDQGMTE